MSKPLPEYFYQPLSWKKIKPLGQVINSKALGRWPRALEFITWPAGLIFFPAYVLIKKILRPPGEEFYSGMASPCQNPIFQSSKQGKERQKCFEILTHMCFEQGNSVENGT